MVVVNNIRRRGRRLGFDVYERMSRAVPLDLVGMASADAGGLGEVANVDLPAFVAHCRFFFNPVRYTSLGLSASRREVGLPVIGLATTELVTVIRNGENGVVDTRFSPLVSAMRALLRDPREAARMGATARLAGALRDRTLRPRLARRVRARRALGPGGRFHLPLGEPPAAGSGAALAASNRSAGTPTA